MKNKKGFTFVEIIMACAILLVLSMAAGSLYYLHANLIKKLTEGAQNDLDAQLAINHIRKNIQNSAWVVVNSKDDIELHSHSHPKIRQYLLQGGDLIFKEDKESSTSMTLMSNIEAVNFFVGAGTEKPGSRFQKVKVEFWENSDPTADDEYLTEDIFYVNTYVIAKQSWDVIYVDPDPEIASTEDGTKMSPLASLSSALAMTYGEYPLHGEMIYLAPYSYALEADATIKSPLVYFPLGTDLTIGSGDSETTLQMGKYTVLYMDQGMLVCNSTPTKKLILKSISGSEPWGGISLWEPLGVPIILNGLVMSDSQTGIRVLAKTEEIDITFKNSSSANDYKALYFDTLGDVTVTNNSFSNNYRTLRITMVSNSRTAGIGSTSTHLIEDNTLTRDDWDHGTSSIDTAYNKGIYLVCDFWDGRSLNSEIKNNDITGYVYAVYSDLKLGFNLSSPTYVSKVYDNAIYKSSTGIEVSANSRIATGDTTSQFLIKNNYIDGDETSYGISAASHSISWPLIVANNTIKNSWPARPPSVPSSQAPRSGILGRENRNIVIKNNYTNNRLCGLALVDLDSDGFNNVLYRNDPLIKNNIIIGEQYGLFFGSGSTIPPHVTLHNNTIAGGTIDSIADSEYSPTWDIKNTIIWGNFYSGISSRIVEGKLTLEYSDVYGRTPSGTVLSVDPKYELGDDDYNLQPGSPCEATGEGGAEMGAYGGDYNSDEGIGVQGTYGSRQ